MQEYPVYTPQDDGIVPGLRFSRCIRGRGTLPRGSGVRQRVPAGGQAPGPERASCSTAPGTWPAGSRCQTPEPRGKVPWPLMHRLKRNPGTMPSSCGVTTGYSCNNRCCLSASILDKPANFPHLRILADLFHLRRLLGSGTFPNFKSSLHTCPPWPGRRSNSVPCRGFGAWAWAGG